MDPLQTGIGHVVGWHSRAAGTPLDALVAVALLRRDKAGRYANTIRSAMFLDRTKPSYVGGLLELSSKRLYDLWSALDDLLRTGRPGAEEERGDNEFFRDALTLTGFLARMTAISTGETTLLAAEPKPARGKAASQPNLAAVDVRAHRGRVPRSGCGPRSPPEKSRPCRRRSSRCGRL
jgi:hypothetical protein